MCEHCNRRKSTFWIQGGEVRGNLLVCGVCLPGQVRRFAQMSPASAGVVVKAAQVVTHARGVKLIKPITVWR